ncbi:hypothetical protein HPB51_003406 [Rhipicephalus microplus]|uniref:Uncharacterized protein n=1 Tax=Rhipicephalus microplus TaxID=6941 RepID=A0A9J6DF54_RHIMP|nr:hypothetical protein HPB51_003406 [Rhipicephalus microplus]
MADKDLKPVVTFKLGRYIAHVEGENLEDTNDVDSSWTSTQDAISALITADDCYTFAKVVKKGNEIKRSPCLPDILRTLSPGPKFAVEPKTSPPKLLATVRQVSRHVPEQEQPHSVSEGVDTVSHYRPAGSKIPLRRVEAFLKEHSLTVLPADKDGGFAILTLELFGSKAHTASAQHDRTLGSGSNFTLFFVPLLIRRTLGDHLQPSPNLPQTHALVLGKNSTVEKFGADNMRRHEHNRTSAPPLELKQNYASPPPPSTAAVPF